MIQNDSDESDESDCFCEQDGDFGIGNWGFGVQHGTVAETVCVGEMQNPCDC